MYPMSRKVQRVRYHLNPEGVRQLSEEEIKAILRGADDLIMRGGRTLLAQVLKGSLAKKIRELGLSASLAHGYYRQLSAEEVLARIDWVIVQGYLDIEYDYRLPLLVYTPKGWEIEKETFATELFQRLTKQLTSPAPAPDMTYLKDRNRAVIWRLLEKIEETGDEKYVPLLEAWSRVDYKKVKQRIRQVLKSLKRDTA
jgi:superfamily II DNA helicase RecQ